MSNVVEYMREFRKRSTTVESNTASQTEHDRVLEMTATEFRDANLAILVRSYLLGDDIYLISNENCKTAVGDKYVTYLPEELQAIQACSPDFIKRIHKLKKSIDGEILTKGES